MVFENSLFGSVCSNWLRTHEHIEHTDPNKLFSNTIGGKRRWGMTHPDLTKVCNKAYYTVQKKDYRSASPDVYFDAWHVSNCLVSEKTASDFNFNNRVRCSLIFVAGPLANGRHKMNPQGKKGDYSSTQCRTFNRCAERDYTHFIQSVEQAFYAALLAMAKQGDTIAILCHVSGGIYAGKWRELYGDRAENLNELEGVVN